MRFKYSTLNPSQEELDSMPRIPFVLRYGQKFIEVVGLVDSGATVSILPYEIGQYLGATWDGQKASIHLAGNLGNHPAMPLLAMGEIDGFGPIKLAFAWVQVPNMPLILGQTNFFMEFDVSFYRSKLEFEIQKST